MNPPTRFADIPDLLAGLLRFPADRPALTFYQGRTRAGRLAYGELLAAVDRFTVRLREQLRLAAGDRLAILSPNRLEVPPLLLAAMRLGVVVVPLNPTTNPADWDYILGHSGARMIFVHTDLEHLLGDSSLPRVVIDDTDRSDSPYARFVSDAPIPYCTAVSK